MITTGLIRGADELTSEWLQQALGAPVRGFELQPIGTGQISCTYRVVLDWDGDVDSVVLKLADADPAVRATGVSLGFYKREIEFYREIATRLPATALARCHAAVYDEEDGYFTLLVDDTAPARVGDQIAGCSIEDARLVVRELARLQGAVLGDAELAARLERQTPVNQALVAQMLPSYWERFGDRVSSEHRAVVSRFVQNLDAWLTDRSEPRGLNHNDFRLDNMLFGADGTLTLVDWATLGWGPFAGDLAFFIGGNLTTAERRAHEEELVRLYHDGLLAAGVEDLSWEACWRAYRRLSFSGVLMAIVAPLMVAQTARGDEMFMTMLARHCDQALDLDALALLSAGERLVPLRVDPADEGRHDPGTEQVWNESWYFDAVSDDGTLGVYVRVGLVPNLARTVYTAYVVGADRRSVAVLDYAAPLPREGLAIQTGRFRSELVCEEPLRSFGVQLSGEGHAFADPAAALRGEAGDPVDVALDLRWETDGAPYQYRITTRYELPCRVSGTIRIGEELLTLQGPGQRDHSWGPRDWWAMDWTWVSAHLDDGSHLQAIELRFPRLPSMGFGYEQHGDALTEIEAVSVDYAIGGDRLAGPTAIEIAPTGTRVEAQPIAYGPLRIEAPDGRVCEFPRAMARIRTADGRAGLGWIEWGHNLPADQERT